MASQSKTKTVKFEVGQLVEFNNRVGRVSRIAKNGSVYVSVLGETTVADQTSEELRVKKADLQLASEYPGEKTQSMQTVPKGWDKIEAGHEVEELTQESESEAWVNVTQVQEEKEVRDYPPVQLTLEESTQQATQNTIAVSHTDNGGPAFSLESAVALAETTYALRELTFSVTRHSILTAFIDVALNKDIPGYHHQVAGNLKNLMAAAFDPVHDARGYARINTWTMAALELVVKNKDRVAKMLSQPIEAAPIKIDRVTKLGMWLDNMMNNQGPKVDDMTSAGDSCYVYDAIGKKLEACSFVAVEVAQAMKGDKVTVRPIQEVCAHLTAQSAISVRKQYIDYWRQLEPDLHLYCGIVPVYKTGLPLQAAIEAVLASVIGASSD